MLRFLLAALLALPLSANAATLIVQDGLLYGANDVDVDGTLFDVRFENGTCSEFYNGCDELSDIPLNAYSAVSALIGQVLIDGPLGLFDAFPKLANICVSNRAACIFSMPFVDQYYSTLGLIEFYNAPELPNPDWYLDPWGNETAASGGYPGISPETPVNLKWTLSSERVTQVPLPATALLLMAGLGVLGGLRRRNAH
ncbi:VPLPA-CTERM sorting domain-containing protein [Albibacillus kandeliae]|uniref:VPLPA-CTERM sorting domain-containing protein n=1 Tax=Albibacillus kandeliae TaxID=2174228 RepID=UPI000D69695C|nr:VPLPA-CTERM sorting domain-containing protein [Albibacillus kandeliae]